MTQYLHLDTYVAFRGAILEYGDEGSFFKAEVLSRVFLVVQSVLFAAIGSLKQATRGVALLFSGYVTFALKDFLSVIVQAIILPILGIMTIVSPNATQRLIGDVSEDINDSCSLGRVNNDPKGAATLEHKYEVVQAMEEDKLNTAAQILLRLTVVVQMIYHVILGVLRNLLTFKVDAHQGLFIPYFFYCTFEAMKNFDSSQGVWNALRAHGIGSEKQKGVTNFQYVSGADD